ncbi:hypothetical protein [Roseibium aggregatum]|nr:hypothetical protein [Roseibium aggregatum]
MAPAPAAVDANCEPWTGAGPDGPPDWGFACTMLDTGAPAPAPAGT